MHIGMAKFHKVSFKRFLEDYKNTFNSEPITEEIKKIWNMIELPTRATKGSCGYDLYSPMDIHLAPGQTIKIPTGIKCYMKDGWFLMIAPRSGHGFKYGLRFANTVGIIDGDYYNNTDNEGHIFIKLINDSSIGKPVHIPTGEAFAQAIFVPFGTVYGDCTYESRKGGLGSTTKKRH